MGFFNFSAPKESKARIAEPSVEFLHKAQCKACPLNNSYGLRHPHMQPFGAKNPEVYILGEAPGETEDRIGRPFVGRAGEVLRLRIPQEWLSRIRWNNCVRTRLPSNRTPMQPTQVEIECCRPSVVEDIERSKPFAIFGFGNVPLHWLTQQTGITGHRGRHMPVQVGAHVCWFFPMLHPSAVLRSRRFEPGSPDRYGSDDEFAFAMDIKRAFKLVRRLPEARVVSPESAMSGIEIATGAQTDDLKKVLQAIDRLMTVEHGSVGFDFETNKLRPYEVGSKLLSLGLGFQDHSFSFAIDHREARWTADERNLIMKRLHRALTKGRAHKLVHNLAFELEWVGHRFSVEAVRYGRWGCSRAQAFVLDERTERGVQSLDGLCIQHFGLHLKRLSNVNVKNLDAEPIEKVLRYNALDAKFHRRLFLRQSKLLTDQNLTSVYQHQVGRVPTVVLTQLKGVPVDQSVVEQFDALYQKNIARLQKKIARNADVIAWERKTKTPFKPASPAQVGKLLRHHLGLKVEKVDEAALEEVDHELARLIVELRKNLKLHSTYVLPLKTGAPTLFPDGLIHPILHTTTTETARTSSADPNSQNFPKHVNKEVRSQIRPAANQMIVSFDYGQIQARNVAMESKDAALVQAFWDRYDIHADWAERIAKRSPKWVEEGMRAFVHDKDVFKKYRQRAKNEFVFASFFGAQPRKLAALLGINEGAAEFHLDDFWSEFPDIYKWHHKLFAQYAKYGYVQGLSGYRRRAPISSNQLINAPIQADEALIVCDAMSRLSLEDPYQLQANMEIHDDLTFVWDKKLIDRNAERVVKAMLDVPFKWAHIVPIVVEMSVGTDWSNLKEVGVYESDKFEGYVKSWRIASH